MKYWVIWIKSSHTKKIQFIFKIHYTAGNEICGENILAIAGARKVYIYFNVRKFRVQEK